MSNFFVCFSGKEQDNVGIEQPRQLKGDVSQFISLSCNVMIYSRAFVQALTFTGFSCLIL
jgi:hypothetical protein